MADGSIRINCDIDINKASKSIDELMSKLDNFKSKAIELKVSADFSEINSQLENFQGLVKRAYSDGIVLTVRGTFDKINEQLENFQDLAERAYSDGIELKIMGDFSSFKSELEELKTLTENFELNQSIKIPFEVTPKTEIDDIGTGAFSKEIISLISKNNEVFSRHPLVVPIIAKGANSGGTNEFLKNSKDYKKLADNIAYFINTIPVGNKLQDVAESLTGFTEKFNTLNISGETIKSLRALTPALDGLSEIPELSGVGENLNVLFRQLSTSKSVNGEAILQVSKAIRVLSGIEKLPQDFSVLEQTGKNINAFSSEISVINLQDDVLKAIGRIVSSVNLLSKTNKVQEDFSNLPKISSNIETYAMNLTGISMDENVMKSIQVVVSSIRSLSNIQKLPENLGSLPDIGNYINLFSNSIDSLNTTEDNVKILRTVISCIRSLASISKLPEGLETLVADGEYIVKFANSISSIEISDIASKNINLITNVLRVISSWQTKELNLEKTSKELLTFAKSLAQLNFGNTVEESQQVSKNIDVLAKAMNAYSSMTSSMSKKSGELDLKPAAEQIKTFIESLTKLENPNNILGSIATIINGLNNVSSTSNKLSNVATNTNKGTKSFDIMNKGLSRLTSGLKGALSKLTSFLGIFKRMPTLARNVATSMKGVSSSIKNSATELLSKVRLIKGSITTLISIFKNLSSAYEDQISAETRFEVSIKNSSDATKKQIKEIKDLTANYQKLGILGDEVQLTGLQELSTYVENVESVKKLLPVMNDMVAQQFGFNATTENAFTIATALGKVLNGNTDTLKRYGYFFDDTQKKILKYGTEEQRVAVLTNVVSSAVGGMNNAMLNTPTGRIVQLKNYFGDLKESLGELLNFAILPLVDGIKTVIINLNLAVKSFTTFIKNSLGIKTVAHDIKSSLDINKNRTSRSVSDTADSLDYLNDSANKAKKSVKNLLSPLDELNILSDSTSDSIADASGYLDDLSLGQGLSETIEIPNFNDLKKKLKDLLGSVSSFDKLGTTLGLKFNTFVSKLKPEKLASQLAGFVNDAVALASSFLGTADFEKLGQKVASFLNTFLFKLDTSRIGKLLAQNLNAIVNFARGIITNFNFKLLGKKIASLINNFVFTFDSKNAAQLLIDAIKGALATTKELLTNTDFVALGESIGDFLNTMLTGLPIGDLADTFGDVIDSIVTTAAAAISKIDFKSTGKNIADGLNKITRRTALWKKVADTFGKAIVGVLELGISLLENTDFSALGTAIGTFIAGLPWGTILHDAGVIIWKALGGVLSFTSSLFNAAPLVGVITSIVGALLAFKTMKGVITNIRNVSNALSTMSTITTTLNTSKLGNFISTLTSGLSGGVIVGIGVALSAIAIGIAEIYKASVDADLERTEFITSIDTLTTKEKDLKTAVDNVKTKIDETKTSISEAGTTADKNYSLANTYWLKLKDLVDENGNVKKGQEELADFYKQKLNDLNIPVDIVNNQIKGYKTLCTEIDKYIEKVRIKAMIEAGEEGYADALKQQVNVTQNYTDAQKQLTKYTNIRKQAVEKINKVLNDYNVVDDNDLLPEAFSVAHIKKLSDYIKDFNSSNRNLKNFAKYQDSMRDALKYIAKSLDLTYDSTKSFSDNIDYLLGAVENNYIKSFDTYEIAEDNYKSTEKVIRGYENLIKVQNNAESSAQDAQLAYYSYTGALKTVNDATVEDLKEQYNEFEDNYKKAEQLVKDGKLSKDSLDNLKNMVTVAKAQLELAYAGITDVADAYTTDSTKKLLESKNFATPKEFIDYYEKLFGAEHIPDAISTIASNYGLSPDSLIDAYILSKKDLSADSIKQLVEKLYPEKTGLDLEAKAASLYKTYTGKGLDDYLKDSNSNISDENKKKLTDKVLKLDKDTGVKNVVNILETSATEGYKEWLKDHKGATDADKIAYLKTLLPDDKAYNEVVTQVKKSLLTNYEKAIDETQKELNTAIDDLRFGNQKNMNLFDKKTLGTQTNSFKKVFTLSDKLVTLKGEYKKIGSMTVEGFISGISDGTLKSKVNTAASNIGSTVLKALKDKLNIHSPSKETESLGKNFDEGFANGIADSTSINKVTTNASNVGTKAINALKPTSSELEKVKGYGTSIINAFASKLQLTANSLVSIGNIPKIVHNKLVSGMNSVISHLSTSSSTFMTYFTNPITRSLSSLLGSMDTFYMKFKNKWQSTMNLFSVPFIGKSMGVTTVPNLSSNYYPFGNNIVKLAQGAVIKPNNEFMAILGDQKRGINIETPLETMKQAFTEALNEGNYGLGDITIPVYIGNKQLDTIILESNSRRTIRSNGRG